MIPLPLRVQLAKAKDPIPFEEKKTSPVGVVAPVPEVSVTVAAQVVFELAGSDDGLQLTLVVVDRPEIIDRVLKPRPFTT